MGIRSRSRSASIRVQRKKPSRIKSAAHTYLNIQADAITWVKEAEAQSTRMRRTRRGRKTPYRQRRTNRLQGRVSPPALYPCAVGLEAAGGQLAEPLLSDWRVCGGGHSGSHPTRPAALERKFQPVGSRQAVVLRAPWSSAPVRTIAGDETAELRRAAGCARPATSCPTISRRTASIVGCWRMSGWVDTPRQTTPPCCLSCHCVSTAASCTDYNPKRVVCGNHMVAPSA